MWRRDFFLFSWGNGGHGKEIKARLNHREEPEWPTDGSFQVWSVFKSPCSLLNLSIHLSSLQTASLSQRQRLRLWGCDYLANKRFSAVKTPWCASRHGCKSQQRGVQNSSVRRAGGWGTRWAEQGIPCWRVWRKQFGIKTVCSCWIYLDALAFDKLPGADAGCRQSERFWFGITQTPFGALVPGRNLRRWPSVAGAETLWSSARLWAAALAPPWPARTTRAPSPAPVLRHNKRN